jgi:predicted membrane protein
MNVLDPLQVSLFIQNVFLLIFLMLLAILVLGVLIALYEHRSYGPMFFSISLFGLVGTITSINLEDDLT